jgi:putative ABC transport system permease protein
MGTTESHVPWSLAGRLLARDWRSGEVIVLLVALVTGVAAISAVAFFTDRVRQAVTQQAGESLAADLRLSSMNPLPAARAELAASHGVATADVVHFRSVVLAGESSSLAHVRGVTRGYPLRGEVRVADRLAGPVRGADGIPARGEVWAEPSLLARLDIEVGDTIEVGVLTLRVAQTLEFRPDEGWRFMQTAPTLLLNLDDVNASELLQPGSVAEYEGLYAGSEAQVATFRRALEPVLGPTERLEDFRDARPEVRTSVRRAERFLVLSALVSVLLGGVAVAMSARRFVERRLDAVALMKCLGAQYREVLRLNVTQLLILVGAAAMIGTLIGFLAQYGLSALLADFVEARLPAPGIRAFVLGPVTALAVAIGFALPPLLQLGAVPPARVLRHDLDPPPLRYLTIYGTATLAVGAMLYVLFRDFALIAYTLGGAVVTFAVLYGAGRLLVAVLKQFRGGVGIAWRYGIANVARRGRESSVQVVAFGIGLMVLLLLTLVRGELMVEWQGTLPEQAANHFMINIQPGERDAVATLLEAHGIASPEFTPLVRARITHLNDEPVAQVRRGERRARRELSDEINLTWTATPGPDNVVTSGEWWQSGDTRPQMSIEDELMRELDLELGDRLRYLIGGESIDMVVTSTRRVIWDSFRPNFFMVANPGVLDAYAHTYLTSFYVAPDQRAITIALAREFPSVSVIDIEAVLEQVRGAMDRAALAVQYVFLFTLVAGIVVLLAAIQATRDERMYESALLRTLGARRGTVLQGVAAEFIALGLLAGTLASLGAGAVGYLIANTLFDLDYMPGPTLWLLGVGVGAAVVGLSGTLAVRSVVNESPVVTLRRA